MESILGKHIDDKKKGLIHSFPFDLNEQTNDSNQIHHLINLSKTDLFRKTISFLDEKNFCLKSFKFLEQNRKNQSNSLRRNQNYKFDRIEIDRLTEMNQEHEKRVLKRLISSLSFYDELKPKRLRQVLTKILAKSKQYDRMDSIQFYPKSSSRILKILCLDSQKSLNRWIVFKQKFRIYYFYFIKKMFHSINCMMACWIFCFCFSLMH